MKRPKVKICGITNLEDARFCAAAGADFLGFIQVTDSPRYVEPALCRDIIEWVHGSPAVGVFVNERSDTVNRVVADTGFEFVQAHGEESAEWCAAIDAPVIKAIAVRPTDDETTLGKRMHPYVPYVSGFLLDTADTQLRGGTGRTFDWRIARAVASEFSVFLAGGLDASNVVEATRTVRPYGIDLSSRLESAPGRKDFDRVAALFDALEATFGGATPSDG